MLKRIAVEQLYELYSYDLNLENEDASPMKFFTGPNGYGKSTILNMLYAVFAHDCDALFDIPFTQFDLFFDDAQVHFTQNRQYAQEDEKSDLVKLISQSLHIVFSRDNGSKESGVVERNGKGNMPNLEMYLAEQNAYYIDDRRVVHSTIDANSTQIADIVKRLNEDAEWLRTMIHDNHIDFSAPAFEQGKPITKQEYEAEVERIKLRLLPLKKWGMVNPDFEPIPYLIAAGDYLREYLEDIETLIDDHNTFINQLSLFEDLVKHSFFANKSLRVSDGIGYRFYATTEHNTPLLPERLSSGERHLLLQLFELIFRAPQGALVLVDEPELSMHMYWQLCYSTVIEQIAKVRHLQCIIATHSPQIFDSMWSRSVDLYQLSKTQK